MIIEWLYSASKAIERRLEERIDGMQEEDVQRWNEEHERRMKEEFEYDLEFRQRSRCTSL